MDEEISKINHFPRREILDLAILLDATLEAYHDNSFILKNLKTHRLLPLIGQDEQGEVVFTGFRHQGELGGKKIESHPNFVSNSPISSFDSSSIVRGVIKLSIDDLSFNIDLLVERHDTPDTEVSYSLTIIPDIEMQDDHFVDFINRASVSLSKRPIQ